jgi:hypothetical protein
VRGRGEFHDGGFWAFFSAFFFAAGGSGLARRAAMVSARWSSAKRKRMLDLADYFAFFFCAAAEFTG